MKNRQLIIHIGTEKTGTSSIQNVLSKNRERLINHNVLYPRVFGKINHSYLSSACLDDDVFDNLKAHILASENWTVPELRSHLENGFRDELNAHKNINRILVSTELIHSRLVRPSEIRRLLDFFNDYVDEIIIVLFLRRQDRLAVSRYSTVLRAGYTEFDHVFGNLSTHQYLQCPPEKMPDDLLDYYDYRKLIERFIPYLGKENIRVALYQEGSVGVIDQFLRLALLEQGSVLFEDVQLNNAMSVEAQFLISQLNKFFPSHLDSGLRNKEMQFLRRSIETEYSGETRVFEKKDAEQFLSIFTESNEWVREQFFCEQKTLFGSEFSNYVGWVNYTDMKKRLLPKVPQLRLKYNNHKTIKDNVKGHFQRLAISLGKRFGSLYRKPKKIYHSLSKPSRNMVRILKWKLALLKHSSLVNIKRAGPVPQPTFALYRILGNDLWPRHGDTQSIDNLKKIIEEEYEFENCKKFFLVNRIFDEAKEHQIISYLEKNRVNYQVIPFKKEEYAKCKYDYESVSGESFFRSDEFRKLSGAAQTNARIFVCRKKIAYAMNVNGARNYTIQKGGQVADWVFPWDGNCVMTQSLFDVIQDSCRKMPRLPLRVIPMVRLTNNDNNFNNIETFTSSEEPQLLFKYNCIEQFDENWPYGIRDKAELLIRFGVPGPWHSWAEYSWLPPTKKSDSVECQFDFVDGCAIRLASGRKHLDGALNNKIRLLARNDAILKTIEHLELTIKNDIPKFLDFSSEY